MKKAIVTGLWSLLLATVLTVPAFAQELVVGGQVVGVQISTEGVVVAGFSEIETESGTVSPAQSAGVHQGDLITAVNGSKVADAQEVISAVGECGGESVCLGLQRGSKSMSINVTPAQSGEGEAYGCATGCPDLERSPSATRTAACSARLGTASAIPTRG